VKHKNNVLPHPGLMQFAVIPVPAFSRAIDFVKPTTPCLEAT
jgi:hypothetical protein